MSQNRQYELVYIVSPEASEQDGRRSAHADRADRPALQRHPRQDRELGPAQAGLRDRPPPRGHLRRRDHHRLRRADEGNRPPPARDRLGHPPPDRARRRGAARRRAHRDARKATQARRRIARGLPPEPAAGERRGDRDMDDEDDRHGRGGGPAMSEERGGGGRGRGGKKRRQGQGRGASARRLLPPAPRLQVLRGEDRLHQLQGRAAADAVHPGARQDPAAADLGHVRAAPAQAADGDRARASAGADSVRHGLSSRSAGFAVSSDCEHRP